MRFLMFGISPKNFLITIWCIAHGHTKAKNMFSGMFWMKLEVRHPVRSAYVIRRTIWHVEPVPIFRDEFKFKGLPMRDVFEWHAHFIGRASFIAQWCKFPFGLADRLTPFVEFACEINTNRAIQ